MTRARDIANLLDSNGDVVASALDNTGAKENVFWQNSDTLSTSYSIPANTAAGTFGSVTLGAGVVVTIPATSSWTIVN